MDSHDQLMLRACKSSRSYPETLRRIKKIYGWRVAMCPESIPLTEIFSWMYKTVESNFTVKIDTVKMVNWASNSYVYDVTKKSHLSVEGLIYHLIAFIGNTETKHIPGYMRSCYWRNLEVGNSE